MTSPIPDPPATGQNVWSPEQQQAFAWREIYGRSDTTSLVQQHRLHLALEWIDSLPLPRDDAALDAGCGAGMMAIELARRGAVVAAIDASLPMLVEARRWSREEGWLERINVSAGDIQALPLQDASFRLVVALGVVPWARHPSEALREMHRVLEPGGFLVVSATNRWGLSLLLDPHPLRNPLFEPIRWLVRALVPGARRQLARRTAITAHSPAEFDRLLASVGLERMRGRTYGFGPLTFFQRRFIPERAALALHRTLQKLADRGVPGLRSLGVQYLVLCRRRSASEASGSSSRLPRLKGSLPKPDRAS
jgi:ubiquinone/menaquinone biosynthesis C-methylase UbiE